MKRILFLLALSLMFAVGFTSCEPCNAQDTAIEQVIDVDQLHDQIAINIANANADQYQMIAQASEIPDFVTETLMSMDKSEPKPAEPPGAQLSKIASSGYLTIYWMDFGGNQYLISYVTNESCSIVQIQ